MNPETLAALQGSILKWEAIISLMSRNLSLAQAELDFLKSLLPKEEET